MFWWFSLHCWSALRILVRQLDRSRVILFSPISSAMWVSPLLIMALSGAFILALARVAATATSVPLFIWPALFYIPNVLVRAMVAIREQIMRARFSRELPFFLGNVILWMKAGKSFSAARDRALAGQSRTFQARLIAVIESLEFDDLLESGVLDHEMASLARRFRQVEEKPHSAILLLSQIRQMMNLESQFRRKSGRILHQIRLQALIMSALYLGVVIFQIYTEGYARIRLFLIPSVVVFVAGLSWVLLSGRRIKWKI